MCGDLFASHSPLTFPTFHPQYSGFFAEDERSPKGYDVFWSVGGTMFTAAGATSEPIVPRGVKVIHTTVDTTELGRTYPVDVPMMARTDLSAKAVLERAAPPAAVRRRRSPIAGARSSAPPRRRRQALDDQAQARLERHADRDRAARRPN